MRLRPHLLLPLLGLLLTAAVPARAQIDSRAGIALQNQILELRHQLQLVENQLASGGGAPVERSAPAASGGGNDLTAELLQRVSTLEEQVRVLRGRVDELTTQQQTQQLADLSSKQIGEPAFQAQPMQGRPMARRPPAAPRSPRATRQSRRGTPARGGRSGAATGDPR